MSKKGKSQKKSSGITRILAGFGIAALVLIGALYAIMYSYFPTASTVMLILLCLMALPFILIIVLLISYLKKRGNAKDANGLTSEDKHQHMKGRMTVTDIKRMNMRIKNREIRTLSGDICATADKILKAVRNESDAMRRSRQFLNYYLPAFSKIITKYAKLEESGLITQDITENTKKSLRDIKDAMEKLLQNIFNNDAADLSVEMEAIIINCKRDGLLDEDDFVSEVRDAAAEASGNSVNSSANGSDSGNGDSGIKLTL